MFGSCRSTRARSGAGRRWPNAAVVATLVAATTVGLGVGATASVADTAPPAGQPATVSADALPTAQMNGVAWAQVTVNNIVYVTGSFTTARPAGVALGGAGSVTRSNLLAYDIRTGVLTSFNHSLNAQGRAITASPDGSVLYVGGEFTTVDGVARSHIAAFSTATGALLTTFAPTLNSTVDSITATNATVYAGGAFSTANGVARSRLASFTTAGALNSWNPGANADVYSSVLTPDGSHLVVGGSFTTLAGATATGMGSVTTATGASAPWAINKIILDGGQSTEITSLSTDGTSVFGAGLYVTAAGNFEGRFAADPATGAVRWLNSCHGDTYSTFPVNGVLYSAGHEHDCSDIGSFSQDSADVFAATHHYVAAESTTPSGAVARHPLFSPSQGNNFPTYFDFAGQPVATQLDWYPTLTQGTYTGQNQAAWTVSGNSSYVAVGGEFPTVNGTAQQGLVRFAVASIAPDKVGPTSAKSLTPTVYSQSSGTARVAWTATWDEDNTALTYRLFRDGGSTAIYTTTVNSTFYVRPDLGFLDTGLAPGSSHSYRVSVTDPFGNSITSGSTTVTVGSATPDAYTAAVLGDGATDLWPLSETSGAIAADRAGYYDLALSGSYTRGAAGPIAGSSATATTFAGGETTPTGGPPGPPPSPTPNDTAGSVGNTPPTGAFSEEAWFKTTSTSGGGIVGEGLYPNSDSNAVDKIVYLDAAGGLHFGIQANTTKQTVDSAGPYNNGVWHQVVATFDGSTADLYVDGALVGSRSGLVDDIAFDGYWRVGGDRLFGWTASPNGGNGAYLAGSLADVAVYGSALSATQVSTHYTVATGTTVVVNQPPVAAFTSSCTGLACTFDGTGSHDPDGTIASYQWSFGDGATATGATAAHTYATAGTYPVTLVVTDNQGAPGTASGTVTVSAPVGPTIYASDTFARTVTGGFGTATPTGGAWTGLGKTADLSVTPGSGQLTNNAADTAGAYLGAVSTSTADITTSFTLNRLPASSSGYYAYVIARRVSSTEEYLARVKITSTGASTLTISKYDGSSTETALVGAVSLGTVAVGTVVHLHVQATGTAPTTVQARAWLGSAAEPSTWTVSTTDSSAALQAPGAVGLQGYLGSGETNAPITAAFGTFTATST